MCLYNQLFPLKTLTHITSDSLHTVGSKAITHSLDEIGREFFYMECHKIVTYTSNNRSWDFEFIQHRARFIELRFEILYEIARICCRWYTIKSRKDFEHTTADNTTSLPYTEYFAEIDSPLKLFFSSDDKVETLKVRPEIDQREGIVEKCR